MSDSTKTALRNMMKQKRSQIAAPYRIAASSQICTRIHSLKPYQHAQRIAFYFAIRGEVNLNGLWKSASSQGKVCYFPVIHEDSLTLSFLPATPDTPFKKNRYGIHEPDVNPVLAISLEKLDAALIPVVAFDRHCIRIGMGAGYYDRTFKEKDHCPLFGVAYEFQRVDHIEPDPWDIPLNAVITQHAIYKPV